MTSRGLPFCSTEDAVTKITPRFALQQDSHEQSSCSRIYKQLRLYGRIRSVESPCGVSDTLS